MALVVVCAVAVGALKLLARRVPRSARGLRVVEELSLGARRSVYVIEAAGRCFLVGAGEGPLSMLAELDVATVKGHAANATADANRATVFEAAATAATPAAATPTIATATLETAATATPARAPMAPPDGVFVLALRRVLLGAKGAAR